ncbi:hypothetical protein EG68_11832 [Paragonimus skrjabini miyazakii]|uniref:Uncharacterized protein n=1 Tax=Paragonimus skrjabini miyazakii TaxID=59628 RepID=A0A8S9YDB3_9TREM|nr:hypothetical protein EG68_11832 [Paragonimus skrjabini miyazakii]
MCNYPSDLEIPRLEKRNHQKPWLSTSVCHTLNPLNYLKVVPNVKVIGIV